MNQMNRHQRRAIKHDLARSDYSMPANGISHDSLTSQAFERLAKQLADHGNVLSEEHQTALYALCGLFTQSAQHKLIGRWAFGLPTGMGKTSAIIAWCSTLVRQGHDHVSVAVSASKIEALCALKRDMVKGGVPEDRIGLLYSDGGRYSEPCTLDNADRPIMLVSHARVRSGGVGLERFNTYRGKPRDLLIYDESLIASDAKGVAARELKAAVAALKVLSERREGASGMFAYLDAALVKLTAALKEAAASAKPQMVKLDPISEADRALYRSLIPRRGSMAPVETLLDLAREDLRVVSTSEGGAVWYEVAVPRELSNVLILDASYSIRELCKADATIKDAEKHLDPVKRIGKPLSQLKDYSDVELKQLFIGGGRDSMGRDYSQDPWDRRVTKEIVDVVKTVPADQSVLIFVFKSRVGSPDFATITLSALQQAGIDTRAKVVAIENGTTVQRDRINVATWGMETSLNSYAHCQNVILAGVLHRSTLDLAGVYLGQRDDLKSVVTADMIRRLVNSEVCHCIYQALSRGTSRVIDNGKARPMKGWVIHKDIAIQSTLSNVMPGVRWAQWESKHGGQCLHVTAKTTQAIVEHLKGLSQSTTKVSTRSLKAAAGLTKVPARTFTDALQRVPESVPWRIEGRSLVRLFTSQT